jgi:hypothetical protein
MNGKNAPAYLFATSVKIKPFYGTDTWTFVSFWKSSWKTKRVLIIIKMQGTVFNDDTHNVLTDVSLLVNKLQNVLIIHLRSRLINS